MSMDNSEQALEAFEVLEMHISTRIETVDVSIDVRPKLKIVKYPSNAPSHPIQNPNGNTHLPKGYG